MKITPAQYEAAYKLGRRVYTGEITFRAAADKLERIGLNRTSASFYITNLKHLLNGTLYQRAMSVDSTEKYFEWIQRDYGEAGIRTAVRALRLHIPYFKQSSPSPMIGHVRVLKKYQVVEHGEPENRTALDDLLDRPEGNTAPDRGKVTGYAYKRDQRVRNYVVQRANGKCEYCGQGAFILPDGSGYVEAHHIIALASDGCDTVDNVIGLCPNHHREAHYGVSAQALEQKFIEKLRAIEGGDGRL